MAIDSASRRASVLGVALAFTVLVIPDGAISQPDRQTIAQSYSGITAGVPVIDTEDCFISLTGIIDDSITSLTGIIEEDLSLTGIIDDSVTSLTGIIEENTSLTGIIEDSVTSLTGEICV